MIQAFGVMDPSPSDPIPHIYAAGESAKCFNTPFINSSAEAGSSKLGSNCSNPNSINFSCLNPVFVGQEASKGDDSNKLKKNETLVPKLIGILTADSRGESIPNRHTAISFTEKKTS